MIVVVVLALWLLVGVTVAAVETRRGHWRGVWILGPLLGPFSIPLALAAREGERSPFPRLLHAGTVGQGGRDVLVAIDGSAASIAAAHAASNLLDGDIHTITLATVLDFDADDPPAEAHWSDEVEARTALDTVAREVHRMSGVRPSTVLLFGPPAPALATHAAQAGYDLVVAGRSGHGRAKALLGSCAAKLAGSCPVPVLLVPPTAAVDLTESGKAAPASGAEGRERDAAG